MKKILTLFVALIVVSQMFASSPSFNWKSTITVTGGKAQSTINYTQINKDGSLFTLSGMGSHSTSSAESGTFMGRTFTGAPCTSTSDNDNLLLTKSDLSGNLEWAVNSNMGDVNISSSSMIATSDGGAFLALKARHTNRNEAGNDIILQIVNNDGTTNSISMTYPGFWVYQMILVKIDNQGKVEWMNHIPVDTTPQPAATSDTYKQYTPDGFHVYASATDSDGNFYIAGNIRKTMTFGTNTVLPRNTEDWNGDSQKATGGSFVIKLNSLGEYIWDKQLSGASTYDNIKRMKISDDKLIVVGGIQGKEGVNAVQFGSSTLPLTTSNSIYAAQVNFDGSVNWAQVYPGIRLNNKNTFHIEDLNINETNKAFYISGGVQGGIAFNSSATEADLAAGGTMFNPFFLVCDPTTGICEKGTIDPSTSISKFTGIIHDKNNIYAYGYSWKAGKGIVLNSYDLNCMPQTAINLMTGGGMCTSLACAAKGDKLFIAARIAGKQDATFLGDATFNMAESSWTGVIASFTFAGKDFNPIISIPDGNASISSTQEQIKLYASEGMLHINSPKNQNLSIYSIGGQVVMQTQVVKGQNTVALNAGIYIVEKQKVVVF